MPFGCWAFDQKSAAWERPDTLAVKYFACPCFHLNNLLTTMLLIHSTPRASPARVQPTTPFA
jgi:hypothetical protein